MSDIPRRIVTERWWHRLLKVSLVVAVLVIALAAAAGVFQKVRPFAFRYSWHDDWNAEKFDADARQCAVAIDPPSDATLAKLYEEDPPSVVSVYLCGDFIDSAELYADVLKHRGSVIGSGKTQAQVIGSAASTMNLRHWAGYDVQWSKLPAALTQFALSVFFAILAAWGLFRLAIYVAHGRATLVRSL